MHSTLTIQTIQQIKDSVERPEFCARLGTLEPNCSKRFRAARYVYGAVKIMDLLRDDLTANDVEHYEYLYKEACSQPNHCCSDRLDAAKDLWDYVLCLDQSLSHARIRCAGARTPIRDECACAVLPTTCIEPPKPQCKPLARTPGATNPCQLPITWYPAVLVPAFYYPGLAWHPVPVGSDKVCISPVVWTRE